MRVLISWSAYKVDYLVSEAGSMINPAGPHCELYEKAHDYDLHILLSGSREDTIEPKFLALVDHLQLRYEKKVQARYLNILDVISIQEITTKLSPVLANLQHDDVEAYISPGTPSMQTAWYLLASEYSNMKLFHVRPKQYRDPQDTGIRNYIHVERSSYPKTYVVREHKTSKTDKKNKVFMSSNIEKVFKHAEKIAATDRVTTLITGETGTGKELIAQHIHSSSNRRSKKFIPVNCSALADDLLESRLFGHEKASFTGATHKKEGAFKEADNGTIFLDEIGDMSPKLQQTLLRVIQERKISPIGTFEPTTVDVRIIAATHRDLWKLVERGSFREDLLYRLAVAEVETLPIRGLRTKEIKDLIDHFLLQKSILFNRRKLKLTKEAKIFLVNYHYPGNVRELEHLVERFYTFCEEDIKINDIPDRMKYPKNSKNSLKIKDLEIRHIQKVLKMFSNNKTKTSKALGIGISKLNYKIEEINNTREL